MKKIYQYLLIALTLATGAKAQQNNGQPIQLVGFTVQCDNGTALIKWTTATETNNDYFTIERTTDGITYDSVGTVKGAGNSIFDINYQFTDKNPVNGTSYYRLTQTSFDGVVTPFPPIAFELCSGGNSFKACYEDNNINVVINSSTYDTYLVIVTNRAGKVIVNRTYSVSKGSNFIRIAPNCTDGLYMVNVYSTTNNNIHYFRKLIMGTCAYRG